MRQRAKAARRPDLHNDRAERRRRAAAVAAHLSADHVAEVGAGGHPGGPLVVRCGPCNSARSANLVRRVAAELGGFPKGDDPTTPRPSKFPTHTGDDGPAVA
jgi:hypothetical protein